MQLNFTINIDERIVNFFKRICTRRNVVTFIITAVIGTSIFVYAQVADLTVFTSGTVISSADVNANFAALAAKGHVFDAADQDLGAFVTIEDASTATIISPNGYLYNVTWKGLVKPPIFGGHHMSIYFTTANCTGTPFIDFQNNLNAANIPAFEKFTYFYNATPARIFKPKFSGSVVSYQNATRVHNSYKYSWSSICQNAWGELMGTMELEEVTYTGAGIPATITPPLEIRQ